MYKKQWIIIFQLKNWNASVLNFRLVYHAKSYYFCCNNRLCHQTLCCNHTLLHHHTILVNLTLIYHQFLPCCMSFLLQIFLGNDTLWHQTLLYHRIFYIRRLLFTELYIRKVFFWEIFSFSLLLYGMETLLLYPVQLEKCRSIIIIIKLKFN